MHEEFVHGIQNNYKDVVVAATTKQPTVVNKQLPEKPLKKIRKLSAPVRKVWKFFKLSAIFLVKVYTNRKNVELFFKLKTLSHLFVQF